MTRSSIYIEILCLKRISVVSGKLLQSNNLANKLFCYVLYYYNSFVRINWLAIKSKADAGGKIEHKHCIIDYIPVYEVTFCG